MGSLTFKQLKEQSGHTELQRLRNSLAFKLGTHKHKRLVSVAGKRLAKRTILDEETHAQHATKLFSRFMKAWGYGGLTDAQARERLRLLTVLDTVCVVETTPILQAVEQMEAELRVTLSKVIEQIGIVGVSEVEIVNLGLYGTKESENETRKGQVLRELAQRRGMTGEGTVFVQWGKITGKEHLALVHFHGIVDLGKDAVVMEQRIGHMLRQSWKGSWCVELKRLFAKLSVRKSLSNLAGYMTKGGNDTLRFRKHFGNEFPEAMELSMVKHGHAESGEYDDHLGLSIGEVSVLVKVYDALMRRNSTSDGYLFLGGEVIRNRYQPRHGYRIWKTAVRIEPFEKSRIAMR